MYPWVRLCVLMGEADPGLRSPDTCACHMHEGQHEGLYEGQHEGLYEGLYEGQSEGQSEGPA